MPYFAGYDPVTGLYLVHPVAFTLVSSYGSAHSRSIDCAHGRHHPDPWLGSPLPTAGAALDHACEPSGRRCVRFSMSVLTVCLCVYEFRLPRFESLLIFLLVLGGPVAAPSG